MKQIIKNAIILNLIAFFLCCCNQKNETSNIKLLCDGSFSGMFSPFAVRTINDDFIMNLVHASLLTIDSSGKLVGLLADYEITETVLDFSKERMTICRFSLKPSARFSNGIPVTADDVIFTYMAMCDPTYNGLNRINALPIVGINEYCYDDPEYENHMLRLKHRAYSVRPSDDQIQQIANKLALLHNEPVDAFLYGGGKYENETLKACHEEKEKLLKLHYQKRMIALFPKDYIQVPEIEGIRKLDDRTVEVVLHGFCPDAARALGLIKIIPAIYYNNGLSLIKGHLENIYDKSNIPVGAGVYKLLHYENNCLYLERNDCYCGERPAAEKLSLYSSELPDIIDSLKRRSIDGAIIHSAICEDSANYDIRAFAEKTYGNLLEFIIINSRNIENPDVKRAIFDFLHLSEVQCASVAEKFDNAFDITSAERLEKIPISSAYDFERVHDNAKILPPPRADENNSLGGEITERRVIAEIPKAGFENGYIYNLLLELKNYLDRFGWILDIVDVDNCCICEANRIDKIQILASVCDLSEADEARNLRFFCDVNFDSFNDIAGAKDFEKWKLDADASLGASSFEICETSSVFIPIRLDKNILVYNPAAFAVDSVFPAQGDCSALERLK